MKYLEILLLAIAAVLAIVTKVKWKELKTVGRSAILIGIAASIVGFINACNENKKRERIERVNSKIGEISDLDVSAFPSIQFGDSGMIFRGRYGAFAFNSEKSLMKAYVREGKLVVSFVIRDPKGKVIGSIYENEWEMVGDDYDYNNDATGIEVVTKGDRKVLFQLDLRNGVVHFLGLYCDSEGVGQYLFPNTDARNTADSLYNIIGLVVGPSKEITLPDGQITALFKYPREKHLGERAK